MEMTLHYLARAGALFATDPALQPSLEQLVAADLVQIVMTPVGQAVILTDRAAQILTNAGHPPPRVTRPQQIAGRLVHQRGLALLRDQGWSVLRHLYESRGRGRFHDGLDWSVGTGARIVYTALRCSPDALAVLRGYYPDRTPRPGGLGHSRLYTRMGDRETLLRGPRNVHKVTRVQVASWCCPAFVAMPYDEGVLRWAEWLNDRWMAEQQRRGLPMHPAVVVLPIEVE